MNDSDKKIRLNIVVDPIVFPEIHAELCKISIKKKRIGGKRLLTLASLGLLVTRQGYPISNNNYPPIPTIAKNIDISKSAAPLTDGQKISIDAESNRSILTENEYADFEKIMNGDF